ncbi:MAG: hypothetical protein JJU34_05470 [Lunatimonas sp.]|uniref:hypothetical protein n=1 Tax=Lunatimonas sp. TaxID=2060141 RepID=UPI00263AF857|nr:hypothetical protein [Lunatimonas sp.]MCC5936710.1 hypothetical protein [Lunatimonas sp.]
MKTLITLFLAISVSTMSFANPIFPEKKLEEVAVLEFKDQRFNLIIKEAVGKVTVSIYNEKGKMIDKVSFRANEPVSVPFNLTQIPEGEYRVHVSSKEDAVTFPVTSKKPLEKKLFAYAKATGNKLITLTVFGIEKPGTEVTFYDSRTQRKINFDYVEEYAGFSRDYRLADTTVDKVYMEVKDANGNTKTFHF